MKNSFFLLCILLSTDLGAQTLQPVHEFIPGNDGGDPQLLTIFNNKLYMSAKSAATGRELWHYDGTTMARATTSPPTRLNGYFGQKMAVLGGKLYFPGYTDTAGIELMVYDGVSSPSVVADILPGSGTSGPYSLRAAAGKLFFSAETPAIGNELYVYDGINPPAAFDLYPGILDSNPQDFTLYNNKVYFRAASPATGAELWVYDPALDTVRIAADIVPGGGSSEPAALVAHGGKLYFVATTPADGPELWSYDGTSATRLTDIGTGANYGVAGNIVPYNNFLYFSGNYNNTLGGNYQLYRYDPVTGDASLVHIIDPVIGAPAAGLTVYDNKLYFIGTTDVAGPELWVHDGTNTTMVTDFNPGQASAGISELTIYNNELYMSAKKAPATEPELYKLSNTTGIRQVRFAGEVSVSPNPADGDALLHLDLSQPYNGVVSLTGMDGRVVWQSSAKTYAAGQSSITLPLAGRPAGIYFYQVSSKGQVLAAGRVVRR